MVSGYPISTNIPWVNGLSTDPREIGRHRYSWGLKQSIHMWYICLSVYLLKKGYVNNLIYLGIFIYKSQTRFEIIVVYIDDLNLVETPKELIDTTKYLNK